MAQKKVGFSNTSSVQGDRIIVNNGVTASVQLRYDGSSNLSLRLPLADGSSGQALVTDGSGRLSFGTVSGYGTITGSGTVNKHAYWSGTQSLSSSQLQEGTNQLLFPSGTVTVPGISFLLDTNTGFYRTGAKIEYVPVVFPNTNVCANVCEPPPPEALEPTGVLLQVLSSTASYM